MSKSRALALIVAVVGSLLYLYAKFYPAPNLETYYEEGRTAFINKNYDEAEKQFRHALQEAEKFADDDPRLRLVLTSLAETYQEQDKHAEVGPVYKRILEFDEKTLGPDHPNVASNLNNLANNYRILGKYAEAEPLYRRALEIWVEILGPDNLLVAHIEESYADTLRNLGRVAEADRLTAHAKSVTANQENVGSTP
jgi:tetratricopeptide (TPR) repeat protein